MMHVLLVARSDGQLGLLLAELHGRMGYFPSILRLRPVRDSLPPAFEIAEILNLQALRDRARQRK